MTGTGAGAAGALREDPAELFLVLWQARQTLQWLFDESLADGRVSQGEPQAPGAPPATQARKRSRPKVRKTQPARVRPLSA